MTDKEDKEPILSNPPDDGAALWKEATRNIQKITQPNDHVSNHSSTITITRRKKTLKTTDAEEKHFLVNPTIQTDVSDSFQTDGHTERKLRQGKIEIDATIDLHGKNAEQAYDALVRFIQNQYRKRNKILLVITGKGKGILKSGLADWIKNLPLDKIVLRIHKAHPRHGGEGAYYIILRKNKRN